MDYDEQHIFGSMLTSDHKVLLENQASRQGDKYAIIIQDSFTKWLQAFPTKTKGHEEVIASFKRFMPPGTKPDHVYTDNSKEFIKAMQDLNRAHDTSTPYRLETNGVVERAVRRGKEGTAAALFQSGLPEEWWDEAMLCYCFLHNVHDMLRDGLTAFEARFADSVAGPIIPFGAQIEYKPAREMDIQRLHTFGKKTHTGSS